MTFGQSVQYCFTNYINFKGRAGLSQFWWFTLFVVIVDIGINIVDLTLFGDSGFHVLAAIWGLVTVLPHLAVGARRLHDIGMSGWLQLLWLIPCLGWIVIIVLYTLPTKTGENRYGTVTV